MKSKSNSTLTTLANSKTHRMRQGCLELYPPTLNQGGEHKSNESDTVQELPQLALNPETQTSHTRKSWADYVRQLLIDHPEMASGIILVGPVREIQSLMGSPFMLARVYVTHGSAAFINKDQLALVHRDYPLWNEGGTGRFGVLLYRPIPTYKAKSR